MVGKDQGRRTSHRNRDHCWVTRAAECSSQQDLGTADSQHPAILPCSTPHLFSLEIIHTAFKAFKIHETIQNQHQISWAFCKLDTAGEESVITLHRHCLWMQHIPMGKRASLHLQFTLTHCMPCTHSTMLSVHQPSSQPGAQKSMFHLLLPSALSFLAVSWINVSTEEYLNNHKTVYQHHHRAYTVHPAFCCVLFSCHSMSSLGKCKTGVPIIIFLLLYEYQPVQTQVQ